ncbi:MAG: LD-carboxypeptidase [Bacilli bacterium]|nr:LD-carboxypeptidase [Bacilli bacterium]
MIYPKFINTNDTIGITAPSDGITRKEKIYRLNSAIKNINNHGFKVKETANVRTSIKGKSSSSNEQAKELINLFQDNSIKAIICAAGGDFLLEILPHIDFNIIKNNPKWIQGYSDPTSLLYIITTTLDIATIYGNNFGDFGMNPWHPSLTNNIEILQGTLLTQTSFDKYEKNYQEYKRGDEPYVLTEPVYWQNINNEPTIQVTGRIIGGCIDCLNDLFGTRFDNTKNFIEKYKRDGIIWYFDNCEFSSEQLIRTLHKFKDNGWFNHAKCIIFGRSATESSYYDISLTDAIKHSLNELNIPIIINADIGHVSPRMTIINGAIATITSNHGKGKITFELK